MKSVTPANSVPVELSTLTSSPAFDDVDELNIDLGPYWESMWAAYFLRDHHLHLVQPTYYAVSSPTATWTLLRRDAPVPPGTVEVRLINGTYQLVR